MTERTQPKTDYKTLQDTVMAIIRDKQPELEQLGPPPLVRLMIGEEYDFLEFGLCYAMDEARQEVRRDIAVHLFDYCYANGDARRIGQVFKKYSTEAERITLAGGTKRHSADLDITIDAQELYENAMEHGEFYAARTIAMDFGLGKELADTATTKFVEERIDRLEEPSAWPSGLHASYYRYMKEGEGFDNPVGQRVALNFYHALMRLAPKWNSAIRRNVKYEKAAQVAREAGLDESYIKRAEWKTPGVLVRHLAWFYRKLEGE